MHILSNTGQLLTTCSRSVLATIWLSSCNLELPGISLKKSDRIPTEEALQRWRECLHVEGQLNVVIWFLCIFLYPSTISSLLPSSIHLRFTIWSSTSLALDPKRCSSGKKRLSDTHSQFIFCFVCHDRQPLPLHFLVPHHCWIACLTDHCLRVRTYSLAFTKQLGSVKPIPLPSPKVSAFLTLQLYKEHFQQISSTSQHVHCASWRLLLSSPWRSCT